MPLSEDDIREILRLIDESDVAELRVETEASALRPSRRCGGRGEEGAEMPRGHRRCRRGVGDAVPTGDLVTISSPMIGMFYRAEAPGAAPFVAVGSRSSLTRSSA